MAIQASVYEQPELKLRRFAVTKEFVAYLALAALVLVLRVANLDIVALSASEVPQALAAWRVVHPNLVGNPIVPQSALIFVLQNMSFTVLGGSEFSARILTALAGAALVFTPLLFRNLLGRTRTFIGCVFLAFSPVALLASRYNSAMIWAVLFALLTLWAIWRYWETQQAGYATATVVFAVSTALLTEAGGLVLSLILGGAAFIALNLSRTFALDKVDDPGEDFVVEIQRRFSDWRWQSGALLAALVVLTVGTSFLLYPANLSAIGETVIGSVRGLFTPVSGMPAAHTLLTSLFYEPFAWGLALAGIGLLVMRGRLNFIELFLIVWLGIAAIVALIYIGGRPEYAMWLVVPLAGLGSYVVTAVLEDVDDLFWHPPTWGKWLLALIGVALLLAFSISFQSVARWLMNTSQIVLNTTTGFPQINGVLVVMSVLFAIVGFFLAASIWGNNTALRGVTLGLFIFGLVTSLSSGWNTAVLRAGNPAEPWHLQTSTSESFDLRATLLEVAKRETGGFPDLPVAVVGSDNSMVAWLLRDFTQVRYVSNVTDAAREEIAILPYTGDDNLPDLGGSYIGQKFVLSRAWDWHTLRLQDIPTYFAERQVDVPGTPLETVVLWLRQDIYEGVNLGAE